MPSRRWSTDGRTRSSSTPASSGAAGRPGSSRSTNCATCWSATGGSRASPGDAAWHRIIDHARTWRQPWIAVAGLARPLLVARAEKLRTGREQVIADVESELVAGFIDALLNHDLAGPRPQLRMCWAGWRAALLVREPAAWEEAPDMFDPSSRSPTRPYGHPDLLLGRAARLGIIGADDAELISSGAARQPVPAHRRQVALERRRHQATFVPEPTLDEAIYRDVLEAVRSWARSLERTPKTADKLDEEELRDLLLGTLNGYWRGAAGGELCNGSGKTDILIRAEDRNAFIAECKIWRGTKSIVDAVNQLLSYLVWRDSKAALVIFIKTVDPAAAIEKLHAAIQSHPRHVLTKRADDPSKQVDYVMAADDEGRRVSLAVMPVVIRASRDDDEVRRRKGSRYATQRRVTSVVVGEDPASTTAGGWPRLRWPP